MSSFGRFYLDREKDMIVNLEMKKEHLFFTLSTPNHHSGNLIRNLASLCSLPLSLNKEGLLVIKGEVPSYIDAHNQKMYIFRLGGTKVANIYPNGHIEMKASIPSISKTLMSQTKDYRLGIPETIIKTYVLSDVKFTTDLHTHMNANLSPDVLIALGIAHQIRYPYYYIKKLKLRLSPSQKKAMEKRREKTAEIYKDSLLRDKYLDRKIDDNTFINFADLILNNPKEASYNIPKIRSSLSILKDGQAVFTNLEKVYLYRYVFTKGLSYGKKIALKNIHRIEDDDIRRTLFQMLEDRKGPAYRENTLFQDKLLWIARYYRSQGISYVEISDTALVKKNDAGRVLKEIHDVMEKIYEETHVRIRFLAALRRIPLTIIRENIAIDDYLQENLDTLAAVAKDPYVAGSDIVGEEINDIRELTPLIKEITRIAVKNPGFVIRIHAGENDSLRGNVVNALQLIQNSLKKGEKMPYVRIGHGLYTPSLHSEKGRQLLKLLKENNVVLEFQITSNVRLNNLNHLSSHPLKKYLREGIHCVEGSDGAALYGSSSIDEQLSLEKLLKLSHEDLLAMRKVEEEVEKTSKKIFEKKMKAFLKECGDQDVEVFYRKKIEDTLIPLSMPKKELYSSYTLFPNKVAPFPEPGIPLIIAGGSFNHDKRTTRTNREMRELIDELLEKCDPNKVFFVIGHSFSGYERYLLDHNDGRFMIFSYVPALISRKEKRLIESHPVHLRVSTEIIGMSLYKSFNYEIFERRPSILLALDGNSAGANLIQEARNGKAASRIFVYSRSPLKEKALSLKGYTTLFSKKEEVLETILQAVS